MYEDYNLSTTPIHRRTLRKLAAPSAYDSTRLVEGIHRAESGKGKGAQGKAKALNKRYDRALSLATNPNFNKRYLGMTKDEVQKLISKGELSGAELARIDAKQLTAGQNWKALKHQLKNQKYTPSAILKRGWQREAEGGGGYMFGTRQGRHVGLGGKSVTGLFALGDAKDAVNRTDASGQGRSRTERVSHGVGGALGSVAGGMTARNLSRVPGGGIGRFAAMVGTSLGGMMGGYYLGGKAGKYLDKGVSRARGVQSGDYMQDLKHRAGFKRKKDGSY